MLSSSTILCVEDNPENRLLVRRILQAEGFNVLESANAVQALEVVKAHTPDLILMDINMPEMDGYTLTDRLKESPKLKHIPIVALTANVMRGDRERILSSGFDGYIQKPIDVDTLPQLINHFLKEVNRG